MCKLYYQQNKDVSKNNFNDKIINLIPKKRLCEDVNNIYMEQLNNYLNKNKEKKKANKKKIFIINI